jgi:Disulfide bond chaperones of the HSP33 family
VEDYLIQGMGYNNEVRFFAAYSKAIAEDARKIHDTTPVCTAALGRTLTAGAMMGAMLKNDSDLLTIRFNGDGPAKSVTVTADSKSNVKGIISNPHVELPIRESDHHLDVGAAIGHGYLSVIRDTGLKEPYVGQTQIVSGEIAEDLTYYFANSEQIPTVTGLGVLVDTDWTVKHAGGFIIQLLPFASEKTISSIEDALKDFSSVTDYLNAGETPEEIMERLLDDMVIEDRRSIQYKCNCDRKRVTKALISLGHKELQSMIADGKPINLHCDFCGRDYEFNVEELKLIDENI